MGRALAAGRGAAASKKTVSKKEEWGGGGGSQLKSGYIGYSKYFEVVMIKLFLFCWHFVKKLRLSIKEDVLYIPIIQYIYTSAMILYIYQYIAFFEGLCLFVLTA